MPLLSPNLGSSTLGGLWFLPLDLRVPVFAKAYHRLKLAGWASRNPSNLVYDHIDVGSHLFAQACFKSGPRRAVETRLRNNVDPEPFQRLLDDLGFPNAAQRLEDRIQATYKTSPWNEQDVVHSPGNSLYSRHHPAARASFLGSLNSRVADTVADEDLFCVAE